MKNSVSRITLAAALACASPAIANATDVNDRRETTISTSTANNGAPDNITITEDGSIEFEQSDGAVAVIVDSDNSVDNEGDIIIEDSDDAIGIRITANRTGNIVNSGQISLIEDYDREDTDDDDDLDGPLAIGRNRVGILLEDGGVHTGDIVFDRSGTLTVEGNQSAGIRLLSELDGSLEHDGRISVIGDQVVGIDARETITGDMLLSGSVTATGEGAIAVRVDEGVDGALTVESSLLATGYTSTGLSNYVAPASVTDDTDPLEDRRDADDLLQGGPSLAIGGTIGQGILINGNIDKFISEEDTDDETKDTIEDFDENRSNGSISSFGSAPAVLITPDWGDGTSGSIQIGTVVETVRDTLDDDEDEDETETLAVFEYDYGLINRGSISANGLNVGVDAIAVRIAGSEDGQFTTTIDGGVENTGTIAATAFEASASGLSLGLGSVTSRLNNSGSISATISTQEAATAYAIVIDNGAVLNSLENSGTVRVSSQGNAGEMAAILDKSGTLTNIKNTGRIEAAYAFDGINADLREDSIAIDLRATTADITFLQEEAIPIDDTNFDDEIDSDDVADPRIVGDIFFGSGNDLFESRFGDIFGNIDLAKGSNTLILRDTDYRGDTFFAGIQGTFDLSGETTVDGDLSFAAGMNSITLSEGAIFSGNIFSAGSSLDISVTNSELRLQSQTALSVDTLTFSGESVLDLTIDPLVDANEPLFSVRGAASLSSGTVIRPVFTTVFDSDFTRTIISADQIDIQGDLDTSLRTETRFLYDTVLELTAHDEGELLNLTYSLKSAETLGLDSNQSAAYKAVLQVFGNDDELGFALASVTDGQDFFRIYNQVLPQRSEASTRYLSAQSSAGFGSLSDRLDIAAYDQRDGWRAWIQEHYTFIEINESTDSVGYNGGGFGFSAGFDREAFGLDAIGISGSFSSGEFEEATGGTNPVSTTSAGLGLYAKKSIGIFDLRAAGQVASIGFDSRREVDIVVGEDDNLGTAEALEEEDILTEISGEWRGLSTSVNLSAATQFQSGRLYVKPAIVFDYFGLNQDSYTETTLRENGLTVSVSDVQTDRLSTTARMAAGVNFGDDEVGKTKWGPEARLGYRAELSSTPYEAEILYAGADESFTIRSTETYENALIAGISLSSDSEYFSARLAYDVELMENGAVHYIGATASYKF